MQSYDVAMLRELADTAILVVKLYFWRASDSSLTANVKLALSVGFPPLNPGYSQSKSKPSNLYFRVKFKALSTNVFLVVGLLMTREYFSEPSFQPPTANRSFSLGFNFRKFWSLVNAPKTKTVSFRYNYLTNFKFFVVLNHVEKQESYKLRWRSSTFSSYLHATHLLCHSKDLKLWLALFHRCHRKRKQCECII